MKYVFSQGWPSLMRPLLLGIVLQTYLCHQIFALRSVTVKQATHHTHRNGVTSLQRSNSLKHLIQGHNRGGLHSHHRQARLLVHGGQRGRKVSRFETAPDAIASYIETHATNPLSSITNTVGNWTRSIVDVLRPHNKTDTPSAKVESLEKQVHHYEDVADNEKARQEREAHLKPLAEEVDESPSTEEAEAKILKVVGLAQQSNDNRQSVNTDTATVEEVALTSLSPL